VGCKNHQYSEQNSVKKNILQHVVTMNPAVSKVSENEV
jgi:hypothetical protein